MRTLFSVALGVVIGSVVTAVAFLVFANPTMRSVQHRMPFQTNIVKTTAENQDYRHVLFTGAKSQLVVMSIPPGGEVGQETHPYVEQTLFFQSGTGEAILDGKTSKIGAGDVVVVTPGTQHNFVNTGKEPLQIFTIYTPANHISGRIQHTIQDEKLDIDDEAFGEAAR